MGLCYEYPDIDRYARNIKVLTKKYTVLETIKRDTKKISYKLSDAFGNKFFCKVKLLHYVSEDEMKIYELLRTHKHQNVNKVVEIMETDKFFIVISEFVHGEVLLPNDHAERNKNIIKGVIAGVNFLHSHDIIHSDLKMTNIMVSTDDIPIIVDFDLSKLSSNTIKLARMSGTRFYLAPETVRNHIYSPKMDVWAVGIIIYLLYCGLDIYEDSEYFFDLFETDICFPINRFIAICSDHEICNLFRHALVLDHTQRPSIIKLSNMLPDHHQKSF